MNDHDDDVHFAYYSYISLYRSERANERPWLLTVFILFEIYWAYTGYCCQIIA